MGDSDTLQNIGPFRVCELEFPTSNGSYLRNWYRWYNQYLQFHCMNKHKKVALASLHFKTCLSLVSVLLNENLEQVSDVS